MPSDGTNRSRWSRNLFPALLVALFVFVCGKLLLTPVPKIIRSQTALMSAAFEAHETGWPWAFTQTLDQSPSSTGWPAAASSVSKKVAPTPMHLRFSTIRLLADVGGILIAAAFFAWIVFSAWKNSGSRLRLSLRMAFVLITVIACGIGWWVYYRDRHARLEKAMTSISQKFGSTTTMTGLTSIQTEPVVQFSNREYTGPAWLRRLVPEKWLKDFYSPTALRVLAWNDGKSGAKEIADHLVQMPEIRELTITSPAPPNQLDSTMLQPFSTPGVLDHIEGFSVRSPAIGSDLEWISKMPRLRRLEIRQDSWDRNLDASGFKLLAECRGLELLRLQSVNIAGDALVPLLALPRLRDLSLSGSVASQALDTIARFPALESLKINVQDLTDEDATRLTKMPQLLALYAERPSSLTAETRKLLSERPPNLAFMVDRLKGLPIGEE